MTVNASRKLRYLSVCSGIEAATVAWHPLGWEPVAFAEIERFPSAVLAHHYPHVPNWGDLTRFKEWPDATLDLLVGGTPCQSFSVAGLRAGLADPRGNLALTFLAVAERYRPRWVVWENVPGVLSSVSHDAPDPSEPPPPVDVECDGTQVDTSDSYDADESHAFGCFLAGLFELGYGWQYRTLDAQYFGLAQRRRRVFVVGHLGDWRRAAAVLLEPESMSGHPAPRRASRQASAPTLAARTRGGGGLLGTDAECDGGLIASHDVAQPLLAKANSSHRADAESYIGVKERARALTAKNQRNDADTETLIVAPVAPTLEAGGNRTCGHRFPGTSVDTAETLIAHALRATGFDASEDGTGRGTPLVPVACEVADTLTVGANQTTGMPCGAFGHTVGGDHTTSLPVEQEMTPTLRTQGGGGVAVAFSANDYGGDATEDLAPTLRSHANGGAMVGMQVRRLTPRECERLQGFPDDYTLIPYGKRGRLAQDGPRYKALGNSMAVPVMRWVGRRIALLERLLAERGL